MTRLAVQLGVAWVRVAVDDPRPRLLVELPVGDAAPAEVLWGALAALLDRPVDELVVVQAWGAPPAVPPWVATAVRMVPAAVAAVAAVAVGGATRRDVERDAGETAAEPLGWTAVIIDAGHSGTDITHVSRGRVVACHRVAVGGAALDAATAELLGRAAPRDLGTRSAEVRAARETLSLQPVVRVGAPPVELPVDDLHRALAPHLAPVVDGVRRVRGGADPGRSPPVLLVGGVARMPLLAELLDAAHVGDVRVIDRPDSAAVLGALQLPLHLLGPTSVRPGSPSGDIAASTWLPPVPPRRCRPVRAVAAAAASVVALAGLYAAGAALPPPVSAPVSVAAAGELVQYGYALRLPAGWAHTGGLPERRRSLLTPDGAPDGSTLISVERTPLGYDADAEPRRARAELRAEFARAVAGGAPLSGFDDDVHFAGRPVVGYREVAGSEAADPAQVDWFVVLDGDSQLSVGCRHTVSDAAAVAQACETVVGSMRRTT